MWYAPIWLSEIRNIISIDFFVELTSRGMRDDPPPKWHQDAPRRFEAALAPIQTLAGKRFRGKAARWVNGRIRGEAGLVTLNRTDV